MEQRLAFVAARGFGGDDADLLFAAPRRQLGMPDGIVRHRQAGRGRKSVGFQAILADIDAGDTRELSHPPCPLLANSGCFPCNRSGLRKTADADPRSLSVFVPGGPTVSHPPRADGMAIPSARSTTRSTNRRYKGPARSAGARMGEGAPLVQDAAGGVLAEAAAEGGLVFLAREM